MTAGIDSRERGRLAEERVGEALRLHQPWWFIWSRAATTEEDILGIDRVIYTRHVGRILLQVKSSESGARDFRLRTLYCGRPYRVHVVVAPPELAIEVVLGRVLAACVVAIEEAQAARCLADDRRLIRLEAA